MLQQSIAAHVTLFYRGVQDKWLSDNVTEESTPEQQDQAPDSPSRHIQKT